MFFGLKPHSYFRQPQSCYTAPTFPECHCRNVT